MKLYEIRVTAGLGLDVVWLPWIPGGSMEMEIGEEKVCWAGKSADVTWSSPGVGGKGVGAAAWESLDQRTWEGKGRPACRDGLWCCWNKWGKGVAIGIRCCS